LRAAALAPGLQNDVGDAGVGERRAVVERGDAGDGDDLADPGGLARNLADLVEHLLRSFERSAVGLLHARQQVALVLDRQEAGGDAGEAEERCADDRERDDDHQPAAARHAPDQAGVAAFEAAIDRVEAAIECVAPLRRHWAAQPHGAIVVVEGAAHNIEQGMSGHADAGQPRDLVLEAYGGEVAEIEAVSAVVGRGQGDDLQDRRRLLLHVDALDPAPPAAATTARRKRGSAPAPARS
jgi:hypothetical protein